MGSDDTNGRTHEPSLRELTAELDGLAELMKSQLTSLRDIIEERDRLYKERDEARKTAMDAALSAAKEAVGAALTAADRAVAKAETANEKRFDAANEFRGQLADQAATFYPRREADIRFDALVEKVDSLRESRSEAVGSKVTTTEYRSRTEFDSKMLLSLISLAIAGILLALRLSGH